MEQLEAALQMYIAFVVAWSLPRLGNKIYHYISLMVGLLLPFTYQFSGLWVFPLSGFALGYGLPKQVSKKGRLILVVVGIILLLMSTAWAVQNIIHLSETYPY
ncbi:TPA: hypothetical protein ACGO3A_001439 [Streptococcus suis]